MAASLIERQVPEGNGSFPLRIQAFCLRTPTGNVLLMLSLGHASVHLSEGMLDRRIGLLGVNLWNAHFAKAKPACTPSAAKAVGRRFHPANTCWKSLAWSTPLYPTRVHLLQELLALRADIGLPGWVTALSPFYSTPLSCSASLP